VVDVPALVDEAAGLVAEPEALVEEVVVPALDEVADELCDEVVV